MVSRDSISSAASTPPDLPDGGAQHYAQSEVRKVTVSSLLGTMIEYYDFFLYTTMAGLVFGKLFFPVANSVVSTIAAFGTVAVGYIARPLGGLVFGHFGDKIGRKSMLMVTMGLMGMASALIGTLPTYSAIGITAPILLVFLRVVQGLAVGGEWGGAALMVVERSDPRRRGFWSGLMLLGTPLALFLSTGVVDVVNNLSPDSLYAWGWRIPFLLSFVLLVVGLYVRHKVSESPVFKEAKGGADQSRKTPVIQLLRRPRPLVLAAAVGIASQLFSALTQTHLFAYAPSVGFDKADVLKALLFESCVSIVTIPLFSALSDRLGRRAVFLAGAIGSILFAFPLYAMVNTGSVLLLTLAVMIGQVFINLMYSPLAALLSEMFGTEVRYTGVSLGYQLAAVIGAGFTPLVATSLVAGTGGSSIPLSMMIVATSLIAILAIWRIGETRGRDLVHSSSL